MHRFRQFLSGRNRRLVHLAALVLVMAIAVTILSQAAFAQNVYVITDGDQVLVHTTSTTDPANVLDEAGLSLGTEDTYITLENDGVSEITIQRNQNVTVVDNDQVLETDTYGETVEQLLDRLGVKLGFGTTVSADLQDETYDGMVITIIRSAASIESTEIVLPYETIYEEDETLPIGQEEVRVAGQDGLMIRTTKTTAGITTVLSEDLVSEPVNEVIAQGSYDPNSIVLPNGEKLHYERKLTVVATAYSCDGRVGITATGTRARVGAIAVDPRVIPYGTRMYIVSSDGYYVYGYATAEDCGGDINGNRIDLYYNTTAECFQFGRRSAEVYILG